MMRHRSGRIPVQTLALPVFLYFCAALVADPARCRGYFGYVATYAETDDGLGQIHVLEVHQGGPAATAGLLAGDRIYSVNGQALHFENDLAMIQALTAALPGEKLKLELWRNAQSVQTVLTVGVPPSEKQQQLTQWITAAEEWFLDGGEERCRFSQEQLSIYRDLEQRAQGDGIVLSMERSGIASAEVTYSTGAGERLAVGLLESSFLDALEQELPVGEAWTLELRAEVTGNGQRWLSILPTSGPRAGQRGILDPRALVLEPSAAAYP